MNLSWIAQIMDQQIQHLKNDPEEMLQKDLVSKPEYDKITDRNAFAIHQILHLKKTIEEFIKEANKF